MTLVAADSTTLALASIVLVVLCVKYKLRPPPPQLHPFLLGRQSIPSLTRAHGESPVYSSANNKPLGSTLRPDKAVRTIDDILRGSLTCLEGGKRGSWAKGGEKIVDLVKALRAGLVSKLGKGSGRVVVAVEDPTDALLVILALATSSFTPLVVSPGSSLPDDPDIKAIVHSATNFVSSGGVSANPETAVITLGSDDSDDAASDLLTTGKALVDGGEGVESATAEPRDVALVLISNGVPLELSHVSLTASLVSWLGLFPSTPSSTKPTIKDTIFTFHHPATPYGLGLALFAISMSASLSFPPLSSESTPEEVETIFTSRTAPPATLVFAPTSTLGSPLYTAILQKMLGDSSFIIRYSREGKLRLLREGNVAKQTFWDTNLFQGVRQELALTMLRGVFLDGAFEQSKIETLRCALGTPVVSTLSHPFLLAPLAHGHFYDFQRLPPPGATQWTAKEPAHVGAPAAGVEIKLRGNEDDIATGRVRGEILLRSPVLPRPTTLPSSLLFVDESLPTLPPSPGKDVSTMHDNVSQWLQTGIRVEVASEGTLWTL